MPFVTELDIDGEKLANPGWEAAERFLNDLFSRRSGCLHMYGPHEALLTICVTSEHGAYVSVLAHHELDEFLVVDPRLGMARVEEDLGGRSDSFPRCVFVSEVLALQATREFFNSGRRANELTWKNPVKLWSEAGLE